MSNPDATVTPPCELHARANALSAKDAMKPPWQTPTVDHVLAHMHLNRCFAGSNFNDFHTQ